jgi:hypothetical protein
MGKYNKANLKLARKHKARIVKYRDLPTTHQLAITFYMAINGEAWGLSDQLCSAVEETRMNTDWEIHHRLFKKALRTKGSLSFYAEQYGNWKFGIVDIPTKVLCKELMRRNKELRQDFKTFKEFKTWWKNNTPERPNHRRTNRWPCILSGFDDEVLEDGWHRFYCYTERGDATIPCVFYPDDCRPEDRKKRKKKYA